MRIHPYLNFNGDCEAAMKFYQKCLGGEIEAMHTYRGTPAAEHAPLEFQDKVLHARLKVDGDYLMGSDAPPGQFEKPRGMSVTLQFTNPSEAERVFAALSEGGDVTMPIDETFWAARFGMFVDKYGISWLVNCGKT